MRYPFYWAPLKHCSGSGDQIKMRCRRLGDIVNVCTIKQSGETATPKVERPGGDVMKRTNHANHSRNAKESGHFAAVRTLICRSTWYNIYSFAPIVLWLVCWWNIHSRTPINARFGFDSPCGRSVLIFEGPIYLSHERIALLE
jgi:hypothetical protein